MFTSGPPLLPGFTAASVCRKSCVGEFLESAAVLGADDAEGHGVVQSIRIADRQHPFADLELPAVAPIGGDQLVAGILITARSEPDRRRFPWQYIADCRLPA